jgi:hypothetical protein
MRGLLTARVAAEGRKTVWLTTFDPETRRLPLQEIPVETIVEQADRAGVSLILVPVGPGSPTSRRSWPPSTSCIGVGRLATLVFGDLRLEDVRRAREAALRPWCEARGPPDGFRCGGSRMKTLLERLESSGATVTITASSHPSVAVGARLVARVARGSSPRRRSLRRKRRVPHARRLVARSFDYRSRASRSVVM